MKIFFTAILGIGLTISNCALASKWECPQKKGKYKFKSISIYDGNPKKNVDLAPDNANSAFPHKWTLSENIEPWFVCHYNSKIEKLHRKKLPGKFATCETVESKSGTSIYNSIECK